VFITQPLRNDQESTTTWMPNTKDSDYSLSMFRFFIESFTHTMEDKDYISTLQLYAGTIEKERYLVLFLYHIDIFFFFFFFEEQKQMVTD
jgi:hypothetical protein